MQEAVPIVELYLLEKFIFNNIQPVRCIKFNQIRISIFVQSAVTIYKLYGIPFQFPHDVHKWVSGFTFLLYAINSRST